ncbi:hypothetical protein [Oerskovia paurometabola]|uniref:hypothetical protein n=1 Tax=Oerskovia paurometabola TaxID=162170 RepID=UPI00382DFC4A
MPCTTAPATVADRLEPDHREGDLVMGKRPSAVASLVERSTRYLKIVPLPDGIKAKDVSIAVARALFNVPPGMRNSLTWDRGRVPIATAQGCAERLPRAGRTTRS